jgi:hypothetical protein
MSDFPAYEPCLRCNDARKAGDHRRTLACQLCKGTGLTPSAGSLVCNGCGGSMTDGSKHDGQVPCGIHQHVIHGQYGSPALSDCTTYTFSMCEHCLRTYFASCKIPPKTQMYDLTSLQRPEETRLLSYAEDHELYLKRQWDDRGGAATARLHAICNQTRDCGKPALWSIAYSERVSEETACDEHKEQAAMAANAVAVPFVPDPFFIAWRETKATVADGVFTLTGDLPKEVANGLLAVLFDTTYRSFVVALDQAGIEEGRLLKGTLSQLGATPEEGSGLAALRLPTARGFRREQDKQALRGWILGMLYAGLRQHAAIRIDLVDGWRAQAEDAEDGGLRKEVREEVERSTAEGEPVHEAASTAGRPVGC